MIRVYLNQHEAKRLVNDTRECTNPTIFCFIGQGQGKELVASHVCHVTSEIVFVTPCKLNNINKYMVVVVKNDSELLNVKQWAEKNKYIFLSYIFEKC